MKKSTTKSALEAGTKRAGATEYPDYQSDPVNEKKFKAVGARAHGAKVASHPTHTMTARTQEERRAERLAEAGLSESK